jgi:hypothetical protein
MLRFYKSLYSNVWHNNDSYVLFCKDCIAKIMRKYTRDYSELDALRVCCALLDVPCYSRLYLSMRSRGTFSLGKYLSAIQLPQYVHQNFATTLLARETQKQNEEAKNNDKSAKWSLSDKRNMKFAISIVGYDPFDGCNLTDEDRKYCFNILAAYCDTEGIKEDGHKIQSVIQITQSQLQCRKLDEMINDELLHRMPDEQKIKVLTATKKTLLDSINKMAKDNNISSNYSNHSDKGQNTLSYKMRQLTQDGYEDIKVNVFDIETCSAMKQVADLSNQSILEKLNLDDNELKQMLKEQRETLTQYYDKANQLEEDNRKLKNEITQIKNQCKK